MLLVQVMKRFEVRGVLRNYDEAVGCGEINDGQPRRRAQ
jgi:hypothetical protein